MKYIVFRILHFDKNNSGLNHSVVIRHKQNDNAGKCWWKVFVSVLCLVS